jgi:opacity protein-like surface antigen
VARALPAAPAEDWDKPPPRAVSPEIPPAARGFQAGVRSGVSLPWGNAAPGDALSARNGWQVPAILDAGFKINKPIFVGIYLGVGYGASGESPRLAELCAQPGFDCGVAAYQLGVQAQYHFGASEVFNPWLGYGLGYELVEQSLSTDDYSETQTSSGFTFLKASLGVD